MQDWKTYKLQEVLSIKNGKTKPNEIGEVPIYGGNGILGYGKDSNLNTEAILIGRVGAYCGAVYYEDREIWVSDNSLFALAKNGFHIKYLFFLLKSADLNRFATGSSQPLLTQGALNVLEFNIPPLHEQRAIASILSAIDDKIELNLQMNKTLEEMAMALYKHWFVDFGPFQNGKFVESELGMIPEGWEVKSILDITDLLSGGTPKTTTKEYWDGDVNWVSAKDIGNGGVIFINETEKTITQDGVNNSSTKILPEDTVILVARGSVGKYGMIAKPMAMNQSCYGLFSKSDFSQGLVYLMFSMLIEKFKRMAYGSVFDTITTSTFVTTNVILPPKEIIESLKSLIDPLFAQLKQNTLENQTLTTLRDTLLPKLISGQIRVKDAEQMLAASL